MPLVRTAFIPVPPGARPGFDHADIYRDGLGGARMYLAHTGADRVDVIDCASNTWLRALPGHPGVAGVLIDQQADRLFTSDRAADRVSVYQCSDEKLLGQIAVGAHPNGLAFDRSRGLLFSFNLGEPIGQNCTASAVDPSAPARCKSGASSTYPPKARTDCGSTAIGCSARPTGTPRSSWTATPGHDYEWLTPDSIASTRQLCRIHRVC